MLFAFQRVSSSSIYPNDLEARLVIYAGIVAFPQESVFLSLESLCEDV